MSQISDFIILLLPAAYMYYTTWEWIKLLLQHIHLHIVSSRWKRPWPGPVIKKHETGTCRENIVLKSAYMYMSGTCIQNISNETDWSYFLPDINGKSCGVSYLQRSRCAIFGPSHNPSFLLKIVFTPIFSHFFTNKLNKLDCTFHICSMKIKLFPALKHFYIKELYYSIIYYIK